METRELVNAAAIVGQRMWQQQIDVRAAIAAARAAGTSEREAMLSGAFERLRVSSILPCLPDNDLLDDRLRVLNGEPSQLMCRLNAQSSS